MPEHSLIEVNITDRRDGSSHCVQAYAISPEEAVSLARLTWKDTAWGVEAVGREAGVPHAQSQLEAEHEYLFHKYLYYVKAEPELSDYDFDQLEKRLREEFPDSATLHNTVGYASAPGFDAEAEYQRRKKLLKNVLT